MKYVHAICEFCGKRNRSWREWAICKHCGRQKSKPDPESEWLNAPTIVITILCFILGIVLFLWLDSGPYIGPR
jgi:hypothetical protein